MTLSSFVQTVPETVVQYTEIPVVYAQEVQEVKVKKIETNEEALVLLQQTFKDNPAMIAIAKCESEYRQWEEGGEVLKGKLNPLDRGMFQINEKYHLENSKKLGYDIYSAEGNIGYAKQLYELNGTRDWNSSKECWDY